MFSLGFFSCVCRCVSLKNCLVKIFGVFGKTGFSSSDDFELKSFPSFFFWFRLMTHGVEFDECSLFRLMKLSASSDEILCCV